MTRRAAHGPRCPPAGWLVATLLAACAGPAPQDASPWFEAAPLPYVNQSGAPEQWSVLEQNGQGICVLDADADGLLDLAIAQGEQESAAVVLLRNAGGRRFRDVTERFGLGVPGWGTGCSVADYDNDGDPDLLVLRWGPDLLFRNESGVFREVGAEAGIAGGRQYSSSAAWADLDGDRHLDLYITGYVRFDPDRVPAREADGSPCVHRGIATGCGPWRYEPEGDRLYRSRGDGTFEDITVAWGLEQAPPCRSFAVVLTDLDRDGLADAYVACDVMPNRVLRNRGGRFEDGTKTIGGALNYRAMHESGMGVATADLDGDRWPELFVTNFAGETNTLYHNSERGLRDITPGSGLETHPTELGWAAHLEDLDADGLRDVVVFNGHIYPQVDALDDPLERYHQLPRLYRAAGPLRFQEVPTASAFGDPPIASWRGAAVADLDGDLALDIAAVAHRAQAWVFWNRQDQARRSLYVRLVGTRSPRDAVGTRIALETDRGTATAVFLPHQGYQASQSPEVHFGVGDRRPQLLIVEWPSGRRERFAAPQGGRVTLTEGEGSPLTARSPGAALRAAAGLTHAAPNIALSVTRRVPR